MEQKTTRELNLVILPNGTLYLEWMDTRDAITESSRLLQKEPTRNMRPPYIVPPFFLAHKGTFSILLPQEKQGLITDARCCDGGFVRLCRKKGWGRFAPDR
ncbi:MAG: hypothetical protein WAL98_18360 [Desulfatiglandaceae bacterium]|jgi:hypothetical protein